MDIIVRIIILIVCFSFSALCNASENIFYVLRSNAPSQITTSQNSLASLKKNYKSIQLLISQAYQIDDNGIVWGYLDHDVEDFAKKHNVKIMVMITNVNFDTGRAHKFLTNTAAQQRAINMLLATCEKNHYYGVQFDYEMIALNDRDELTNFFRAATDALHKKGFVVSYAVAPVVGGSPEPSEYLKRLYQVWEGAYDLQALGAIGDFVTVMSYNQHGSGTTPGPTAGYPWVEETIKHMLQFMPAEKISLGVPTYSNYWYTGTTSDNPHSSIHDRMSDLGYDKVVYLLQKYHQKLHWDPSEKVNSVMYEHNWLNEYIFAEDADSLKAKLELVKKYHLRGISVFYLGIEDPKIWNLLT